MILNYIIAEVDNAKIRKIFRKYKTVIVDFMRRMAMNLLRNLIVVLTLSLLVIGLSGCEEKGPAEKAGEKLDETMEKTGEKVNELLGK